jgi:hypothetical protein
VEIVIGGSDDLIGRVQGASGFEPVITDIALGPDGRLWAISFDSLYTLDTLTGEATTVGGLGLGASSGTNALAADALGNLFAGTGALLGGKLYRLNSITGQASAVGTFGYGISSEGDLAFASDGTLYASLRSGGGEPFLAVVDTVTGTATPVVTNVEIGFADVWGLTFVGDELFGLTADDDRTGLLIKLSLTEGTATVVRQLAFSAGGAGSPKP